MPWPMRQKIMPRSTKAAPMMVPSAIRNVILRNGSLVRASRSRRRTAAAPS
jgi:hypothetical protein